MSVSAVNEAVLHHVLHLMRTGQLQRCVEMGLDPDILRELQHPLVLSVLQNAQVNWVSINIDKDMVKRLMSNAARSEDETRMLDRAIRLGATSQMLLNFFGLTPQEAAMKRRILGVKSTRGRWMQPSEDQDRELWFRFCHLMKEHHADASDSMAVLDVSMMVAEELRSHGWTLAMIWSRVSDWISAGLYRQPVLLASGQRALPLGTAATDE